MPVFNERVVLKTTESKRNKFGEKSFVGLVSIGECWAKVGALKGKTCINLKDVSFSTQFSYVEWCGCNWKVASKNYDPIDKVMRVEIEIKEGRDGGNY